MTDKPILFSGPMIRALLDGRKTQTRQVLKPQPVAREVRPLGFFGITNTFAFTLCDDGGANSTMVAPVPYAPGDRLYVREACATWEGDHRDVVYRADLTDNDWSNLSHDARNGAPWKRRPSIHMPRWASRLTLTVTDVRVQRVQEISEADAFEEGCNYRRASGEICHFGDHPSYSLSEFSTLWDGLNAKRGHGWDANPWVIALTFTVHRQNIDQMEASR